MTYEDLNDNYKRAYQRMSAEAAEVAAVRLDVLEKIGQDPGMETFPHDGSDPIEGLRYLLFSLPDKPSEEVLVRYHAFLKHHPLSQHDKRKLKRIVGTAKIRGRIPVHRAKMFLKLCETVRC